MTSDELLACCYSLAVIKKYAFCQKNCCVQISKKSRRRQCVAPSSSSSPVSFFHHVNLKMIAASYNNNKERNWRALVNATDIILSCEHKNFVHTRQQLTATGVRRWKREGEVVVDFVASKRAI